MIMIMIILTVQLSAVTPVDTHHLYHALWLPGVSKIDRIDNQWESISINTNRYQLIDWYWWSMTNQWQRFVWLSIGIDYRYQSIPIGCRLTEMELTHKNTTLYAVIVNTFHFMSTGEQYCLCVLPSFCLQWTNTLPTSQGGGGTRYIPGWWSAVRPLILWPCLRQILLIFLPCLRQNSDFVIPCLRHLTRILINKRL